jgi:hypothetical protein
MANGQHPAARIEAPAPSDLPTTRDLDNSLNQWAAQGHSLLRRIQERRRDIAARLHDLDVLEQRTLDAIDSMAQERQP